jgi:hypothetical protein
MPKGPNKIDNHLYALALYNFCRIHKMLMVRCKLALQLITKGLNATGSPSGR